MKIHKTVDTPHQILSLVQDDFGGEKPEYAIHLKSKVSNREGYVLSSQYVIKTWKTPLGATKAFLKLIEHKNKHH